MFESLGLILLTASIVIGALVGTLRGFSEYRRLIARYPGFLRVHTRWARRRYIGRFTMIGALVGLIFALALIKVYSL